MSLKILKVVIIIMIFLFLLFPSITNPHTDPYLEQAKALGVTKRIYLMFFHKWDNSNALEMPDNYSYVVSFLTNSDSTKN